MLKYLSINQFLVCFCLFCMLPRPCKGVWEIVWQDEFTGGNLADRWTFDTGCDGWGNNELQCYTENREENARQENGILIIQAIKENWSEEGISRKFTSARMTTKTKASWRHVKFEMRAKLPDGKHLWPAFWMLPERETYNNISPRSECGWTKNGEIDIMEYRGQIHNEISGTIHFCNGTNDAFDTSGDVQFPTTNFADDFNTFGVIWDRQWIRWFVNGREFSRKRMDRRFGSGYRQRGQPFDKPFHLLINMAVGGDFFNEYGQFDEDQDPEKWVRPSYEIDWVRVSRWR